MTALQLIQGLADLLFVVICAVSVVGAFHQRTRTAVDIALFFSALAFAALITPVRQLVGVTVSTELQAISAVLVMTLPYLMQRLLADFTRVHLAIRGVFLGGLLGSGVAILSGPAPLDPATTLLLIGYFAGGALYVAGGFIALARRSTGVTRRRTEAVAVGMGLIGLAVLVAAGSTLLPAAAGIVTALTQLLALGAAIAWLLGFAPPPGLRRYWQEPELRAFLERASTLPRLPTTEAILRELERGVAASFGARAAIGLLDERAQVIRFAAGTGGLPEAVALDSTFLAARVLASQRAEYVPDAARANPANARAYREAGVGPVLLAPITAGSRRLGVLEAFAAHQPIFSADDLALAQLLADQAAVILESRALIDEAARVRAQAEANRLKEDFVSAAAHDLKTPLTTLLGQAQVLELRFARDPALASHRPAVERIAREARRLSTLVEDLLDAARIEEGKLELRREPVDVAAVVRQAAERPRPGRERVVVDAPAPLAGSVDRRRLEQLVDNLVENGLKYSPPDRPVVVSARGDAGAIHLTVRDRGIGIPATDLPHVFDRFHRAANVDARRYAGIGLGLYICRGIVDQHGGRIWVESEVGQGSAFHVLLPGEGRLH